MDGMRLEDAPQWVQDLVVDKALGFLETTEQGEPVRVESVTDRIAKIRVGEFVYTAFRAEWWIS
jgi:hypothetical protein